MTSVEELSCPVRKFYRAGTQSRSFDDDVFSVTEKACQLRFFAHLHAEAGIPTNMGNPNLLPQDHDETFEGKPHDPRFNTNVDPHKDPRFDTQLNPAAVPARLDGATRILILVLGLVLFVLLIFLMYWRFQTPSPRSPENWQSNAQPTVFSLDRASISVQCSLSEATSHY